MIERRQQAHRIGTDAAKQLVEGCVDAKLDYTSMLLACETVITIVVLVAMDVCNRTSLCRAPEIDGNISVATEMVNKITWRAHDRIIAAIFGRE